MSFGTFPLSFSLSSHLSRGTTASPYMSQYQCQRVVVSNKGFIGHHRYFPVELRDQMHAADISAWRYCTMIGLLIDPCQKGQAQVQYHGLKVHDNSSCRDCPYIRDELSING